MVDGKRVLIVGGVAGGASAAARVRRLSEDAQIMIFERGEHISFANCGLPYHIGNVIPQRDRLHELPRDKEILAFCQVGLRAYLACRILTQNGFQCRNLTGGYKTCCAAQAVQPQAASPGAELTSDTGETNS